MAYNSNYFISNYFPSYFQTAAKGEVVYQWTSYCWIAKGWVVGESACVTIYSSSIPADDQFGQVTFDLGGEVLGGGYSPNRLVWSIDLQQHKPKLSSVQLFVDGIADVTSEPKPLIQFPPKSSLNVIAIPADDFAGVVTIKTRMVWEDEELIAFLLAA